MVGPEGRSEHGSSSARARLSLPRVGEEAQHDLGRRDGARARRATRAAATSRRRPAAWAVTPAFVHSARSRRVDVGGREQRGRGRRGRGASRGRGRGGGRRRRRGRRQRGRRRFRGQSRGASCGTCSRARQPRATPHFVRPSKGS